MRRLGPRPRPRTKRTLLMVLLLLTGGAIINVAVAWGLTAWNWNAGGFHAMEDDESQTLWKIHAPSDWPTNQAVDGAGSDFVAASGTTLMVSEGDQIWTVVVLRSGWPLLSMSEVQLIEPNGNATWRG